MRTKKNMIGLFSLLFFFFFAPPVTNPNRCGGLDAPGGRAGCKMLSTRAARQSGSVQGFGANYQEEREREKKSLPRAAFFFSALFCTCGLSYQLGIERIPEWRI